MSLFTLAYQNNKNKALDSRTSVYRNKNNNNLLLNNDRTPDYVLHLQRSIGNQAIREGLPRSCVEYHFGRIGIQPKLKISEAEDEYEQEAERIADRVMRMSDKTVTEHAAASPVFPVLQRKCGCQSSDGDGRCSECANEEKIQRSATEGYPVTEVHFPLSDLINSPGEPLDAATRAFMEPRFGRDMGSVRVHYDTIASASAKAVNALAYTVGNKIVFGAGQFSPHGTPGQRLLAHELAHVVQQTEGHCNALPASLLQRQVEEQNQQQEDSAKALVEMYLGFPYLDVNGLAARLNQLLLASNYDYFNRVFRHVPDDLEDNVAAEMVERMPEQELNRHAASADGRRVLNTLYEAMITGSVSKFERKQAERILATMRVSKREYLEQVGKPMPVYPIREQGFTRDCYSAFRADLLPNGNVRVEFTSVRIWQCDMFKREVATFAAFGGVSRPQEFSPDTLVGVRLYDQNEAFAIIPAIALIDFANQLSNKTISLATTAFLTGLTLGAGALGGGSVAALEARVAAGGASRALLWGARVLLWADRVATVLPVLTEIANENRDWILENIPHGEEFLNALDTANGIAGYYGWARLGFDGLRFMKAQMSLAWSARQAGGIPGGLSASEREILSKIDSETQNALKQLNEGEQALTNEAVNYVNEHPETVKGSPGERQADVGEGHKIEEVSDPTASTGIGCELHSSGGIKVPCPKGMGTGPVQAESKQAAKAATSGPATEPPIQKPAEKPAQKTKNQTRPKSGPRLEKGRLLEYRFIAELKERYPALKSLDIRPKARPSASRFEGAPESSFEERMQTSQGKYSLVVYDEGIAVIELDGISPEGWVQEVKIEQKFEKVDDIVAQLRRQSEFAEAYGLKGVEYSIQSPDPSLIEGVEQEIARQRLRNVRPMHSTPEPVDLP